MEPELGQRLRVGLEPLPRLARSGGPKWSGGLGTLGASAGMGAAATASAAVGAGGPADVEPDDRRLGILEQRNMDSHLKIPAQAAGLVGLLVDADALRIMVYTAAPETQAPND
jgi:hypothetical protein